MSVSVSVSFSSFFLLQFHSDSWKKLQAQHIVLLLTARITYCINEISVFQINTGMTGFQFDSLMS